MSAAAAAFSSCEMDGRQSALRRMAGGILESEQYCTEPSHSGNQCRKDLHLFAVCVTGGFNGSVDRDFQTVSMKRISGKGKHPSSKEVLQRGLNSLAVWQARLVLP